MNQAKSDFAEQLGYTRERFGKENWKVLSNLRVMSVVLKDGRRSTTLQSAAARTGAFDDGDGAESAPEPASAPEPDAGGEE